MATTRGAAILWWLSRRRPQRHARAIAQEIAVLMEPVVTRYPTRRGRGR